MSAPRVAAQEDDYGLLVSAFLAESTEEVATALQALASVNPRQRRSVSAFAGRWHLAQARLQIRIGLDGSAHLMQASQILRSQQADHWLRCSELLWACTKADAPTLGTKIERLGVTEPAYLSIFVDTLLTRLHELPSTAVDELRVEALRRPDRWRPALRRAVQARGHQSLSAATLLDVVGDVDDVALLREFSRTHRGASMLGRGLARRLAPTAHVDDLGRVVLRIGEREVDGSGMRRKVLLLICFLLTKPGFASTRDQVLEALWPELDPSVAVNSLNQTVYFLRRVFDPLYKDDESPSYVYHDGEVIRLDPTLVTSQSSMCLRLIDDARLGLDPTAVDRLSRAYIGQFAMDFAYEEWSASYRQTLHAAYLDVVEQAIRADSSTGHFDRAGLIARRALGVDPDADSVEGALLKIYRTAGSHAAAAEQYSHYAALDDEDEAI